MFFFQPAHCINQKVRWFSFASLPSLDGPFGAAKRHGHSFLGHIVFFTKIFQKIRPINFLHFLNSPKKNRQLLALSGKGFEHPYQCRQASLHTFLATLPDDPGLVQNAHERQICERQAPEVQISSAAASYGWGDWSCRCDHVGEALPTLAGINFRVTNLDSSRAGAITNRTCYRFINRPFAVQNVRFKMCVLMGLIRHKIVMNVVWIFCGLKSDDRLHFYIPAPESSEAQPHRHDVILLYHAMRDSASVFLKNYILNNKVLENDHHQAGIV